MVEMQLTNNKLRRRAITMLVQELKIDETKAIELLQKYATVRKAIKAFNEKNTAR